jgi:hypothetical protein
MRPEEVTVRSATLMSALIFARGPSAGACQKRVVAGTCKERYLLELAF